MDDVPELNESERPGGVAFERAYWLLLSNGIIDSPRDLWDGGEERRQRYLDMYAQPWWESLRERLAEDDLKGKAYLGGDPMRAEHGYEWTVARFELVQPHGFADFGWDLSTARSQRRRELRRAYGEALTRARRRHRLRLLKQQGRLFPPRFRREENPDPLSRTTRIGLRLASLLRRG